MGQEQLRDVDLSDLSEVDRKFWPELQIMLEDEHATYEDFEYLAESFPTWAIQMQIEEDPERAQLYASAVRRFKD
jgi:hypothetical protein